jgi:hypothetical protein
LDQAEGHNHPEVVDVVVEIIRSAIENFKDVSTDSLLFG